MSVKSSSPTRKIICCFLATGFILTFCLSGMNPFSLERAEAGLAGELIAGSVCKVAAGIISHSIDEALHYGADKEGPDYDKALEEISEKLDLVDDALQATEEEIKEIFAALKEMQFYATMNAINPNCAEIETFWADEFIPRFTNKQAGTVSQDQVDDFLDATGAYGTVRPLETDFNQIALSCTHASAGPVLDSYTDEVLAVQAPAVDFSTTVESTNGVSIVAERPMYFDYQEKWDGGHCQAGTPEAAKEFYFAEGTTRPGFDTYLCIQNPGNTGSKVKVSYMRGDGTSRDQSVDVPAHSRLTVNAGDVLGREEALGSDFSMHVVSTNGVPIIAERPMYFAYKGNWDGGHCNLGARKLATRTYLAEGTCRNEFETYVLIQNPNDTESSLKATYMRSDGTRGEQALIVPPRARGTLRPSDVLGHGDSDSFDFSTLVETLDGSEVAVERSIYFKYKNAWLGGHAESGRFELSPTFYFAEGTVRPGFHSYICLQNPSSEPTEAKITFMRGDGGVKETTRAVAPGSRATVNVADVLGQGDGPSFDFSARVDTADGAKISAERVMYFDYAGPGTEASGHGWSGGHCEMGLTSAGTRFHFAEGTVRQGFQPYLCIQNPNDQVADVRVTYMGNDGGVRRQSVTVPAHSRSTIDVAKILDSLQVTGRGTQLSLTGMYYGLENLFGQLFADQVMALDMICEYRNYIDPTKKSSEDFLSNPNTGAKKKFKDEMDCFMDNAERMALCTAYLAEDPSNPGTKILTLTDEGQAIMDRANYLYQMVVEQAIDRFSRDPNGDYEVPEPVVAGTVFTTVDVNAPSNVYAVTAKDQAGTNNWGPVTTHADSITWQRNDGMETKTSFYDIWSQDTTKGVNNAILDYSSEISVTRFVFTGPDVVKGHKYDISHNGMVVGTSTTASYDDEFNPSDSGTNIYGSIAGTVCNNGSRAFMDAGTSNQDQANWAVVTNYKSDQNPSGSHNQTKTNSINLQLSDPTKHKTCGTDGTDSFNGPYDFDTKVTIGRTFTPAKDVKVKVNCAANVNCGVNTGTHPNEGGDFNSYYYFKLVELDNNNTEHVMTSSTSVPGSKHLKMDKDSSYTQIRDEHGVWWYSQSVSGTMVGETEEVSLVHGKRYQFQVYLHLDQNDPHQSGWGPTHLWSNAELTTGYVTIVDSNL